MVVHPSLAPIFKAYDVRGVVPDELDAQSAYAIGAAFAAFALAESGATRVLVAHDMRTTGEELSRALIAGASSTGALVGDMGLASTDMSYFASGKLDAPAAMLTASHNPAQYNGVKMCLSGARPIGRDTGLAEILRLADEGVESAPADGGVGSVASDPHVERLELLEEFAEHVRSFVDVSRLAPLRIVADTANGMGGLVAPRVFSALPFSVEMLFGELDGTFPNHPADPIQPANLVDLRERILATGADVGLAFDGDADRVFLVDERGEPVSGSTTTAIVAHAMLAKHPGATVLYNLICSHTVPEVVAEDGGVAIRTQVGHSFIKKIMADTGAVFGGEHSGHYYFRDNYRADSGIIAALVVLEVLSDAGVSLSQLRLPFERYADSGEINTEVARPAEVVEAIAQHYEGLGATLDRLDGLTAELGDWWFNLRSSNTEPLLRLNVEAPDAAALARHVDEVRAAIRSFGDESA
ncbi:MAG: phosphohexomutase domain-containing protein [Acidimicrobiales bacterium]